MTGCVLGFDFGMRCIGVASGNRISQSARPLPALNAQAGQPEGLGVERVPGARALGQLGEHAGERAEPDGVGEQVDLAVGRPAVRRVVVEGGPEVHRVVEHRRPQPGHQSSQLVVGLHLSTMAPAPAARLVPPDLYRVRGTARSVGRPYVRGTDDDRSRTPGGDQGKHPRDR